MILLFNSKTENAETVIVKLCVEGNNVCSFYIFLIEIYFNMEMSTVLFMGKTNKQTCTCVEKVAHKVEPV